MASLVLKIGTGAEAGSRYCTGCDYFELGRWRCLLFGQEVGHADVDGFDLPERVQRCHNLEIEPEDEP